MLVIQRTEGGSLRLADRRRTGVAEGEAEARRTLYYWGYTDLSINKALAEMRRAEGTLPPAQPWRVVRPGESAAETSADTIPKQSMPKPSRTRRKSTAPADPIPEPPQAEEAAAPPKKRRRASRPKRADAETPAPAPDAAAVEAAEPPAPKKARRSRASTRTAAPPAAEAAPAVSPPAEPKPSETAPAPATKRKRVRTARASAPSEPARAPADADPLADALTLFAEGARRLKQLESGTLPFARAPWTELREQAERILSCLQGKAPKG